MKDGLKNPEKQPQKIKGMFGRISKRYDLLNRLFSLGLDTRWRRFLIKMAQLPDKGAVLYAGAGTGDIAIEIKQRYPLLRVVAADLTYEMITVGKKRSSGIK